MARSNAYVGGGRKLNGVCKMICGFKDDGAGDGCHYCQVGYEVANPWVQNYLDFIIRMNVRTEIIFVSCKLTAWDQKKCYNFRK